jgi:hypothetical protein
MGHIEVPICLQVKGRFQMPGKGLIKWIADEFCLKTGPSDLNFRPDPSEETQRSTKSRGTTPELFVLL